jgi:hypothetical protein
VTQGFVRRDVRDRTADDDAEFPVRVGPGGHGGVRDEGVVGPGDAGGQPG